MLKSKKRLGTSFKTSPVMYMEFLQHVGFFAVLYLLNALVPILICLIAARIEPFGMQYVASIGFITAIQLGFVQMSFTMVISFLFLIKRWSLRNGLTNSDRTLTIQNSFYNLVLFVIFIYGLLIVPLFIGTSYGYNRYAANHINTMIGQSAAYYYIYGLVGFIFINGFNFFFIFLVYENKSKSLGIFLLFFYNTLILAIGAALSLGKKDLNTEQAGGFLGLGLSVGAIGGLIINFFFAWFLTPLKNMTRNFDWNKMVYLFNGAFRQSLNILSIQIIKAFALLALGYTITKLLYQPVPVSIQLTRTIWYNMMYLIPFLTYGISDAILYYALQSTNKSLTVSKFVKISIISLIISLGFQSCFAIAMYYSMEPLANFYATINNQVALQKLMNDQNYLFNANNLDVQYMLEQIAKQDPAKAQAIQEQIKIVTQQLEAAKQQLEVAGQQLESARQQLEFQKEEISKLPIDQQAAALAKWQEEFAKWQTQYAGWQNQVELLKQKEIQAQFTIKSQILWGLSYGEQVSGSAAVAPLLVSNKFYAFIYLVFWTSLYSFALGLSNISYGLKKRYINTFETIFSIFVQTAIIIFVVALGATQQEGNVLPKMDAWTLPLFFGGFLALGLFGLIASLAIKQALKEDKDTFLIHYKEFEKAPWVRCFKQEIKA